MPDTEASTQHSSTIAPPHSKIVTIPGVNLRVAVTKDVIIRIPGLERSYRGKIVGYSPYDYLIASVRLPSRVRQDLVLGGQVTIKYIHQGTVYGFRSQVHNAITSPASLIFFEYPSLIEKIELRRDSRVRCSIDGTLKNETAEHECLVINISNTGCRISVRAGTRDPISTLDVDDTLMLFINLGSEGTLKVPIAVRNIHREQGIMTMGAMFLDLNIEEKAQIQNHLERKRRLTR